MTGRGHDGDGALADDLRRTIREIADFPKPGIVYKDITPVLADAALLGRTVQALAAPFRDQGITHVLGIESRGFIFGAPVALELGAGFVPVRKKGKLPYLRVTEAYQLEYGADAVEIHEDAFPDGTRVLVVDDVLATGGTMAATCRRAARLGARIQGVAVVLELPFLPWRDRLAGLTVRTLVSG